MPSRAVPAARPTPQQDLLLQAAFFAGRRAGDAWRQARPTLDIDHLPGDSIRLLPLVYRNLTALGIDDPELPRLKGLYRRTWYRNQLVIERAGATLQTLHDAGIATLVLKGVALVPLFYEDAGLRPMEDFDVLVPVEKAAAAAAVLKASGSIPEWPLRPEDFSSAFHRVKHGIKFTDPAGFACDLHWRLISNLLPDTGHTDEDFWNAAIPLEVGGIKTLALNSADQMLHVCVHGARAGSGAPARWAADCMMILRKADQVLDWQRLIEQTEKRRAALQMTDALTYLVDVLEAPVPQEIIDGLRRLPTSWRETLAHRVTVQRSAPGQAVIPDSLALYARISAVWGLPTTVARFPGYLKELWNLEHTWQIPVRALRKTLRHLLRRRRLPSRLPR